MPRTGPKTPRGKAVSSRNAFKHAIHTAMVVVHDFEDLADRDALREGLRDSLDPLNLLEELLVERIALNFWKRRRVDYFQAAVPRSWGGGAGGPRRTSGNRPPAPNPLSTKQFPDANRPSPLGTMFLVSLT